MKKLNNTSVCLLELSEDLSSNQWYASNCAWFNVTSFNLASRGTWANRKTEVSQPMNRIPKADQIRLFLKVKI